MPFLGWSKYVLEESKVSCGVETNSEEISIRIYNILLILSLYVVPLIVIIYKNVYLSLSVHFLFKCLIKGASDASRKSFSYTVVFSYTVFLRRDRIWIESGSNRERTGTKFFLFIKLNVDRFIINRAIFILKNKKNILVPVPVRFGLYRT